MILIFGNNDTTSLAAPINSTVTTLQVAPGAGAKFPAPSGGQYFILTLTDALTGLVNEIVWVTNVTGDVFTVQRGKEGTTASPWLLGDFASCLCTAGTQATFIQPDQFQNGAYQFSTGAGSANALSATIASNLTTIPNGMEIVVTASATNTAPATLQITLGSTLQSAVSIYKFNKQPLLAGDIQTGSILSLIYNSSYSGWVLQNPAITQGGAIVGDSRGFSIQNITTATNSLTLTAVSTAVQSTSSFQSVILQSYSLTVNTSGTGAGGMDTGSPPTSGFVGIYLLYNPTTGAISTVATNANVLLTDIYSGAHLPSGYTYSALVSVWPTDSSGHFIIGTQVGREVHFKSTVVVSSSIFPFNNYTSVATIVPLNAVSCNGVASLNPTSGSGQGSVGVADYYSDLTPANVLGANALTGYGQSGTNVTVLEVTFRNVRTNNAQFVVFQTQNNTSATPFISAATSNLFIWGYSI